MSYNLENTVAVWSSLSISFEISNILKEMPIKLYNCQNAIDIFMIPCFITVLDGRMLLKDDPDIESWECYLTGFSGRMEKCQRCRRIENCFAENVAENSVEENEFEPEYIPPVILFEPNKRQRDVEGLVALVPPVDFTEPFSPGLQQWLAETIIAFHKKALLWREENDKWTNLEMLKDSQKLKTAAEIAQERWRPKKTTINLKFPNFE